MARRTADPRFKKLYGHARKKPEAVEDHPWGETVFKVNGKVFVFLGHPESSGVGLTVKAPPDEFEPLLELSYVHRAKYVGRFGWVSVTVEDDEALELALELIDDSYELIAPKRLRTANA
ncbi:MAG: MmcQ/YjbR family DNA-binding protein [Gaiellaceae bacterium]